MRIYILVLLTSCLLSCNPDKNKPVDIENVSFSTTDASEMYFNNIRQSAYELEEMKEAGINAYRMTELDNQMNPLEPVLILNWRNDRAYMIFKDLTEKDVSFRFGSDSTFYTLDPGQQRYHAEMVLRIYNAIIEKKDIEIKVGDGTSDPFLNEPKTREQFRIMVMDFLRLVEIR